MKKGTVPQHKYGVLFFIIAQSLFKMRKPKKFIKGGF